MMQDKVAKGMITYITMSRDSFRKSRAKIKKANSLVRLLSRVNLTYVDGCFV
jgi:hypothetical protein